jgi:hypothetical protein
MANEIQMPLLDMPEMSACQTTDQRHQDLVEASRPTEQAPALMEMKLPG